VAFVVVLSEGRTESSGDVAGDSRDQCVTAVKISGD
ncbi:MAG: hypothetical protein ACI91Q_002597, partial [Gammaproteobacteria bacterium]